MGELEIISSFNPLDAMETHRVQICRIIDKILEDPELVSVYKDVIDSLLQANDALALRISEMRIKK